MLTIEERIKVAGVVINNFPVPVEDEIKRKVYKRAITCDVPRGTITEDLKCLDAKQSLYINLRRCMKGLVNADYGKHKKELELIGNLVTVKEIILPNCGTKVVLREVI